MKTENEAHVGKHAFEVAGLGLAPFRFVGASENVITYPDGTQQAGGTCDYCYTGIRLECHVLSADGKKFKVGCNCIEKVGDKGLLRAYKNSPEFRLRQRELRAKREAAKEATAAAELELVRPAFVERAVNFPHPSLNGKTLLDYFNWTISNRGQRAALALVKRFA
jgi:hypothetical protein